VKTSWWSGAGSNCRPSAFQEVYHPESAYLEKAPTAQLMRIGAADRLFSVSLPRITSVPGCAVSSVGFCGDQHRVAALWGFCGARRSLRLARPTAAEYPGTAGLRIPMTTFLVTQRHRSGLPACGDSALIA
jgi:hypothetical protein